MSVYFHKTRKEWIYDFQHRKNRYTAGGFQTKREAQRAEAERKEDVRLQRNVASPRSMAFEELVLRRMDTSRPINPTGITGNIVSWPEDG